jgi:hypothetical protein
MCVREGWDTLKTTAEWGNVGGDFEIAETFSLAIFL